MIIFFFFFWLNSYLITFRLNKISSSNASCVPRKRTIFHWFPRAHTHNRIPINILQSKKDRIKRRRGGMKSISCGSLCLPRGSAYRGRSTDKAKLICKSFSIRRRDRRSLPNRYTEWSKSRDIDERARMSIPSSGEEVGRVREKKRYVIFE